MRERQGRATRELLITTAERLFAARGIAAVSLREVADAAGQRNNAAAHYYFGDKEGLVRAIFAYRADGLNTRRRQLLNGLDDAADPLHALAKALVLPLAEQVDAGTSYVGFLARLYADRSPRDVLALLDAEVSSSYQAVRRLVRRYRPDLTSRQFRNRVDFGAELAIAALARYQASGPKREQSAPYIVDLVAAVAAVLGAPVAGRR